MLLLFGLTGCSADWIPNFGFPNPITDQGQWVLTLWKGSTLAALAVGVIVWGLILFCVVAYRKRDEGLPRQVRYNLPIEVLYTFLPIVVVSTLFYFTAVTESDQNAINNRPALQIGVVGFQWSWQFNYASHALSVTGKPGQPPQLVVPVGEQLHFHLTSPDVIHSFWVVPFLFKRDVIPGHPNEFEVTVTKSGTFAGRCAEFCGIHHDRMLFSVRALPKPAFDTWLANAQQEARAGTNDELSVYTGPSLGASL